MDDLLILQCKALISKEENQTIANLSNVSSWIFNTFDNINWAGFYLWTGKKLVLGPFCGKVACTTIQLGKGVCGTALQQHQTLIVDDVHKFDGHIACDSASNSEIVVPLYIGTSPVGVLDVDSPILNRFDNTHKILFESIAKHLTNTSGVAIAKLFGNSLSN